MPFAQLFILWLALTVTLFTLRWANEKALDAKTTGLVLLCSTILTALTAVFPPRNAVTPLKLGAQWIRNFLCFSALLHFFTGSSKKQSALSGVAFATLLLLLDALS